MAPPSVRLQHQQQEQQQQEQPNGKNLTRLNARATQHSPKTTAAATITVSRYDDDNDNFAALGARVSLFSPGEPRNTPSPIDPESIEVSIGYDPDPVDLALSSVPGQEMFDPRRRKFSEEELKPQPIVKKAKKNLIPVDLKDDRYWARRRKNNVAAKRSRDARRLKENQIAVRAAFLEKENSVLRQEMAELKRDLGRFRNIVGKYEAKHGSL
ncbi:hepatic leukemia factor-like [Lampetra fluviatilis]